MRSKTILSIAAFIIAFGLSTAFASLFISKSVKQSSIVISSDYNNKKTSCFKKRGTYNNAAVKIETVIMHDINNGRERGRRLYQIEEDQRPPFSSSSFPDYTEAVSEYVGSSENLSIEGTPRDFQSAWRKHMKAWRDYADFLDKMKSSAARAELSELEAAELEVSYSADINSTWQDVLSIGRSHGAELY